jgi:hypothetical protein
MAHHQKGGTEMKCLSMMLAVGTMAVSVGAVDASKWELAWSEEFNKEGLVDSTIWNYEKGFIRNREAQYQHPTPNGVKRSSFCVNTP